MIAPKTKSQIVQDSLKILSGTPYTQASYPGSIANALVELLASYQAGLYAYLSDGIFGTVLAEAVGTQLDNIGVLLGRPRSSSTTAIDPSTTNVRLYIDPALSTDTTGLLNLLPTICADGPVNPSYDKGTNTITLKSGLTLLTQDPAITYHTTEAVALVGTDTVVGVPVVAGGTGTAYNIGAGGLTQHKLIDTQPVLEPIAKYLLCTNTADIVGADTESDDNYRYMLSNQVLAAAAANETAIRLAALSVPGVSDIVMRRYTYGVGTFSIYVIGTTPISSEGLLNTVYQAVSGITAYPEKFTVTGPDYLGIKMDISLTFLPTTKSTDQAGIISGVQQAIIDYVNNIPLGGQLIINEIIQRAMDVSTEILDLVITNLVTGRYNQQINRLEFQQPVIVSNLTTGAHQKFYTNYSYLTVC